MKPIDIRNETWASVLTRVTGDRQKVWRALQIHGPASTRQLAVAMDEDILNVRPRVTELVAIDLVRLVERGADGGVYAAVAEDEAREAFFRRQEQARGDTQMVFL